MAFPAFTGSGSPEGVQVGAIGQYYEDTDNGALYAKADDDGMNTGWLGPLVLGTAAKIVSADAVTSVPCDGATHQVDCIIAGPPDWMDNAGNIITAGLYQISTTLSENAAATVPGILVSLVGVSGATVVPFDGLAIQGSVTVGIVLALGHGDVPLPVSTVVKGQTDATAIADCRMNVALLAYSLP